MGETGGSYTQQIREYRLRHANNHRKRQSDVREARNRPPASDLAPMCGMPCTLGGPDTPSRPVLSRSVACARAKSIYKLLRRYDVVARLCGFLESKKLYQECHAYITDANPPQPGAAPDWSRLLPEQRMVLRAPDTVDLVGVELKSDAEPSQKVVGPVTTAAPARAPERTRADSGRKRARGRSATRGPKRARRTRHSGSGTRSGARYGVRSGTDVGAQEDAEATETIETALERLRSPIRGRFKLDEMPWDTVRVMGHDIHRVLCQDTTGAAIVGFLGDEVKSLVDPDGTRFASVSLEPARQAKRLKFDPRTFNSLISAGVLRKSGRSAGPNGGDGQGVSVPVELTEIEKVYYFVSMCKKNPVTLYRDASIESLYRPPTPVFRR